MQVLDVGLRECDVLTAHVKGGVAEHIFKGELIATGAEKLYREGMAKGVRGAPNG